MRFRVIVNAVAINSGVVCDGAKRKPGSSKIASAVEAGLRGLQMQENGKQFYGGDGLVEKAVQKNTIRNIESLQRRECVRRIKRSSRSRRKHKKKRKELVEEALAFNGLKKNMTNIEIKHLRYIS